MIQIDQEGCNEGCSICCLLNGQYAVRQLHIFGEQGCHKPVPVEAPLVPVLQMC
mgnify:CR=1